MTVRIFWLALFLGCFIKSPVQAVVCPPGWKGSNDTGSCYHFSHDKEPWMLATLICPNYGGHLAEIDTIQEETFLENEVRKLRGSYYWIGASDLEIKGSWKWWRTKQTITYPLWRTGEPNNFGQGEDCLQIVNDSPYGWNDHNCSMPFHYICEVPGYSPVSTG